MFTMDLEYEENISECIETENIISAPYLKNAAFDRARHLWPIVTPICDENIPIKEIFVCSICISRFEQQVELRLHMIKVHDYEPISDDVESESDNATSTPLEALTLHELQPMPFKDFRLFLKAKLLFRCTARSNCPFAFENTEKRALHEKCHENTQFNCTECIWQNKNWRSCSVHLWKIHQIDVDQLQCPCCTFKAHASVLVWRHMRVHSKWRVLVLRTLRRKVQRSTQQNKSTNATNQDNAKVEEMKIAQNVNKNRYYAEKTCDICARKFVNGKTLSKHVKTVHNKIKPFTCNICGLQTARKAGLEIHMRQHTGEKPLKCKTCNFATRDPSVLHKHQLRHETTNNGKLMCTVCDYSCIQANAYKRHLELNHPFEYKKISCQICKYTTITPQKLQTHLEDHRKGLIVNSEDSLDATRSPQFKNNHSRKLHNKDELSTDCFLPLESIDSLPHEPAVDTGGVTIPAPPCEDTQFPTF